MEVFYKDGEYTGFDLQINSNNFLNNDFKELKGINHPIKLNETGLLFFSDEYFNQYTFTKNGIMLRQTLTYLMFNYCKHYNLINNHIITPNQFMLDTFSDIFQDMHLKYNFNSTEFKSYQLHRIASYLYKLYYTDVKEEIDDMIKDCLLAQQ